MQLVRNNPNYAMLHAHIIPRPASAMNESVAKATQGMYQLEMISFLQLPCPTAARALSLKGADGPSLSWVVPPRPNKGWDLGLEVYSVVCRFEVLVPGIYIVEHFEA